MSIFDDTRADWGARPPTSIKSVPITDRRELFTHWNGGPLRLFGQPHTACLAAVRAMQDEHMHDDPQHGWSDIGYNGLVCVHARAITGRGLYAAGAHCPDHNTVGLGMQFMVGKGETVTEAMFARMRRLYDDCCDVAGRRLTPLTHRDKYATECAGDQIADWTHHGMPTTEEDDMFTEADRKLLKDARNRVMARPNATPRLMTDKDGAYQNAKLDRLENAIKALATGIGPTVEQAVDAALADNIVIQGDVTVTPTPEA